MKTIILSIVASLALITGGSALYISLQPQSPVQIEALGTANEVTYLRDALPLATSTVENYDDLGTSTDAVDRRWAHLFADYATTVSVDVLDELKVGRNATTTISEGVITTTDLTVTGTCTGCSGASATLQDGYDSSGSDAQITTANNKNLITFLQNTATDPNFAVNIDAASGGQFLVQNSSSGDSTSTVFSINRSGSVGIGNGTGTPAGLTVNATTTIFGGGVWAYGTIVAPSINATSSTASLFAGDIGSTAQRVPNIYATNINSTLLTIGAYAQGDLTVSGDLYVNGNDFALGNGSATSTVSGNATSTWQGGALFGNAASTGGVRINTGGLHVVGGDSIFDGQLQVASVSTSTFAGGISVAAIGGLTSSSGLVVTGDSLLAGKLVQSVTNATSSFAGPVTASSSLAVSGRIVSTPHGGCETQSGATTTINFAKGNGGCVVLTGDTIFDADGQVPNQVYRFEIYHAHEGNNSTVGWASTGPDFTGDADFYFPNGEATTTSESSKDALDVCSMAVSPQSTSTIYVQCSAGFKPGLP